MVRSPNPLPCAALALVGIGATASAQTYTVVVKDGDAVAGVGLVTSIDDLEAGLDGTWLVKVDTDFAGSPGDGVVLVNGAIRSRETDALPLPAGAGVSSYGEILLDDSGRATWNLFLTGMTSTTDSGIFRDHQLILQESSISTAPQFSAGTVYTGFFGAKNDGDDELVVMGSVDDPAIATTTDRALVRFFLDNAGNLIGESVIAKEGDQLGGVPVDVVVELGTDRFEWSMNRKGQVLYVADMNGATTADGFMMLDSTLILREGDTSPLAGRLWETLIGKPVHLNDRGDFAFRGNLDGATTDDEAICVNNTTIVVQEGAVLPATNGNPLTGFGSGPIAIDSAGNVFWTGTWTDATTTVTDVAIFRNQTVIAQAGVTLVGGSLITTIPSVQDNFGISRDGRYLIFECVVTGLGDTAVLVDLQPTDVVSFCAGDGSAIACPCGNTGATGHGCANSVDAAGALLVTAGSPAADDLQLRGSQMPASSTGIYLQGDANSFPGVTFGDGIRCVDGALLRLRARTASGGQSAFPDATDTITLSARGGVLPGSGSVRYYTLYYRNAAAFCTPDTFNATNSIQVTW